jgi:hypothetical protein
MGGLVLSFCGMGLGREDARDMLSRVRSRRLATSDLEMGWIGGDGGQKGGSGGVSGMFAKGDAGAGARAAAMD